VLTLFQEIASR